MKIGEFTVDVFVEQAFWLDGGMMFGVVPKTIWNRLSPSDPNNLIPFHTNLYVLTFRGKRMIFDIGLGDTLSERERKAYGTDGNSHLSEGLVSLGLSEAMIDYVFLSHLHSDHSAGGVKRDGERYIPRFPNATYLIGKEEWHAAIKPDERTAPVYIPERLRPIEEAGQLQLIDGNTELFPGIRTVFTGGHTVGHLALEIESSDERLYYYGDIFPSRHHMKTTYVPAIDLYPVQTMEAKRRVVPVLIHENITLAFDHDVDTTFAVVGELDKKIVVTPR